MRKTYDETITTEDGGTAVITLTAMDGLKASALGVKLMGLIGPGIAGVISALDNGSPEALTAAATQLFRGLNPDEFRSIQKQVFHGAQVKVGDGEDAEFKDLTDGFLNDAFSGNVFALYKLTFAGVRLNFANFSEGLGLKPESVAKLSSLAGKLQAKAESKVS